MVSSTSSEIRSVGGSMSPFILSGSRLVVERIAKERIRIGDVVCFISDHGQGVTHRVMGIIVSGDEVVLQVCGDAQGAWERVPGDAVLYVVKSVVHGFFSYNLEGSIGRLIARIAVAEELKYRWMKKSILMGWDLYRFIKKGDWLHRTQARF